MNRQHRLLPWLAILAAVVLWGVSFISTKVLLDELPPASIALFRLVPALLVLWPLLTRRGESPLPATRADWARFALGALFGTVLYMVLENNGLRFTDAATASMLVASIPVFVLLIESLVSRTRVSKRELGCVLASLAGVWLVLFNGRLPDLGQSSFLGNALVLGAMASWIVYTFIARRLGAGYSGLRQTVIQSWMAAILYLPFALPEAAAWRLPSLAGGLNLLFLGVFCSGLAYVCYLYGLQRLGTILPSAALNLIPVVTIAAAMVALGEVPGIFQSMGSVLIVASLSLLAWVRGRGAKAAEGTPSTPPPAD